MLLLALGPGIDRDVRGEQVSREKRAADLIRVFDRDPEQEVDRGESLGDRLVELAVSYLGDDRPRSEIDATLVATFAQSLGLDCFTVADGLLRRMLPAGLSLPEAEDEVTRLLRKHGLDTPLGHLNQALDCQADCHWAAANGQIRTFFDALLDEIANRLDPRARGLASGQPKRTRLAAAGFFLRNFNEWNDKGTGFFEGLAHRLHAEGPHPGLSNQDDSTFRLHMVLLSARLLLVRFDTWERG